VFGGNPCEVLDISVTGAFVLVDAEAQIGERQTFQLGQGGQSIDLMARVVRVRDTGEAPWRWQVAVTFETVTPATRRLISSIASRVMVTVRRASAAARHDG
jgi:hypothetical protein